MVYYSKHGNPEINPEETRQTRKRMRNPGNQVVLFAKESSGDYMQCVLRMARFKGIER